VARLTLFLGALIPACGLTVNLLFPPEHYGYLTEQALLFLFAIAALLLYRTSINAALFSWCASTQLPVLAMIKYSYSRTGDWSVFILVPWLGLLIVSFFIKSVFATVAFTCVALLANCAIGITCNSVAQAGALCAFTLISSVLLIKQCSTETQKQNAINDVEFIKRGLGNILEAYSGPTDS